MKPSRRVPTLILTAALGFGIWGLAFTYTPAAFSDGDVLSAAALNALLNTNYQAASDAIDTKLDLTGGNLTGPLGISSTSGDSISTFFVENSGTTGYAALFANAAANTAATVAIKNFGTGPALNVISSNGGPLLEGRTSVGSAATITINPNGTIRNAVGSGLPLAYGSVRSSGMVVTDASTSNFTVTRPVIGEYRVRIPGVNLSIDSATTAVSVRSGTTPTFATVSSVPDGSDTVLVVRVFNLAGNQVNAAFGFTIFKPGS